MRAFVLLLLAGSLVVGCAHTYRIRPETPPAQRDSVNAELAAWPGWAVLHSGDTLRGSEFRIHADSTIWQDHRRERYAFPNTGIRDISILARPVSPVRGLAAGAFAGGLSGALAGTVLGLLVAATLPNREDAGPYSAGDRAELVLLGLGTGALAGGAAGGGLGFLLPHFGHPVTVTYYYPPNKP